MTRLGIIAYTNVAPLLYNLRDELEGLDISTVHGVPTEINAKLLSGEVNLANISAYEFIAQADRLRALPDFSISVLGAVYSVNLFHTLPWSELEGKTLAVTTHSATSVKLLETLLRLDGLNATLERVSGVQLEDLLADYPAVLLIGDAALTEWYRVCGPLSDVTQMIRLPGQGRLENGQAVTVTDLAMSWYERTALPFVFSVWATPSDQPPSLEVVQAMRRARRMGIGHLAAVAAQEAARLDLPERIVQHYLWNFRYHLEAPDRAGLRQFTQFVAPQKLELLEFWDV